jgi:hypothetical protein
MATRARGRRSRGRVPVDTEEQPIPGTDEGTTPATADDAEGVSRLDAILASILPEAERFHVQVFRKPTTGEHAGRPVYLSPKLSLAEFSLDVVRERWGGGSYEFRFMRLDDRGSWRIHRTASQIIDGPPRMLMAEAIPGGPPTGSPVAVVNAPVDSRLDRLEKMLYRLVREQQKQSAPAQPSALDMLEKVGAIIQSFSTSRQGDTDVMQWLNLGLRLGAKSNGDREPSGMDKFLGDLAGPFASILTGGAQPNVTPATHAPTMAPPPMRPPTTPEPHAAKLVPVWLQLVGPYLGVVHAWARAGDNAAERAGYVLSLLPRAHLEQMGTAAEADDFVPATLAVLPEPFREPGVVSWMTTFLQTLQSELTEEASDDTATAEGGANA